VFGALEDAGAGPRAVPVPKDSIQDRRLWSGAASLAADAADLWIHHVPPDYFDLDPAGKHASFFFWETDRLPSVVSGRDWRRLLCDLDEIWAPSAFVAEALRSSGVTTPVEQIFPPVDTALFSPGARRPPRVGLPPGFDPSWSVFLYVGTWDPRKRPDLLVRAFTRAFTEEDRALLLIKSYVTGEAARDHEILDGWISRAREGSGHVRSIPEVLSPQEMADLFRFATAFVTASRGEGYCLPAVQAMSAGKPVIAAAWSAFRDYPTLPVEYRLARVPSDVGLPGYSPEMTWAEIDEEDLSRKLRWLHEHRGEARLLGIKGRDWVLRHCSRSVVGQQLLGRVRALTRKSSPTLLEVV
jgi:glycosyltransferase involved in cell wall biosynthesis